MIFDVSLPFTLSCLWSFLLSHSRGEKYDNKESADLSPISTRPQSTITVSFSKKKKKKWPPQLLLSLFLFFVAFVLYGKLKWKESQIVFLQDEKRSSDRNSVYSKDASGGGGNQHIESSLPSSPAPPPRPLSSISTGRIGYKAVAASFFYFSFGFLKTAHKLNWHWPWIWSSLEKNASARMGAAASTTGGTTAELPQQPKSPQLSPRLSLSK